MDNINKKKREPQSFEEYSISPNSGRLRKRVRLKKKKPFFTKKRMKKLFEKAMWILLLIILIYSLIIVIPEMGIVSEKNPHKQKKETE